VKCLDTGEARLRRTPEIDSASKEDLNQDLCRVKLLHKDLNPALILREVNSSDIIINKAACHPWCSTSSQPTLGAIAPVLHQTPRDSAHPYMSAYMIILELLEIHISPFG